MFAEVLLNLPLERSFHYLVPDALQPAMRPGVRVAVPFGPRRLIGVVAALADRSPVDKTKLLQRVIDPLPLFSEEQWKLAQWISGRYACSFGEALFAMVPQAFRAPKSPPKKPATGDSNSPALESPPELTTQQLAACEQIREWLDEKQPRPVLLHGVTGSGKTELYLRAIQTTLHQGRGAICLIPEIALTSQTIDRFQARFGKDAVAVWHSRLSASQRSLTWWRLSQGLCRVIVGARSAVFAPVRELGVIVVDEEHEATYKQEDAPRYHARDVAIARARLSGALTILGSATPAVESYSLAQRGRYRLLELPERIHGRPLPKVEVVDMRSGPRRGGSALSLPLQLALERTTAQNAQAMLLLNRRGFARVAQCGQCGGVALCSRCSVPMVYHAARKALVCHYCNSAEAVQETCRHCGKGSVRLRGVGTERVESDLHRFFPGAPIARMDTDSMKPRESHRELYDAIRQKRITLLVGTQMIAKGFDFPDVTLVGVVSADTALNLPDFRSAERTFNLLTQVAGRAGRGDQPGRVLIQTHHPEHYAIRTAARHDYAAFYAEEIEIRRRLKLPPFSTLIQLTLHASKHDKVRQAAEALAAALESSKPRRVELLGPAPHRIPKLRNSYRMCILLKGPKAEPMVAWLRRVLQPSRRFDGLPVTVDVDPQSVA